MERDRKLDVLRGILIILVVVGHYGAGVVHDTIFLFHMPLFFVLSGYLLTSDKLKSLSYLKNRMITLLIPYVVYLTLDFLFVGRTYTAKQLVKTVWGGRALAGTYWYMTCFIFALALFVFLMKHVHGSNQAQTDRKTIALILVGGA